MSKPSWFNKSATLFFPEILPAAFIVLISPIWEIQLIGRGRIIAPVILAMGVSVCSFFFYWGCREKLRWIVYAAIVGVIITAAATYKLGGQPNLLWGRTGHKVFIGWMA
jgi:hypothetical protein